MFEPHFVCTLNILSSISSTRQACDVSIRDDILAFNRMVSGWSDCRLIPRRSERPMIASALGLGRRRNQGSEPAAGESLRASWRAQRIDDWFALRFFSTNFWIMWSTMFSFQPWHSLAEMQRYMRRFLHLLPGLTRIAGILRTRYNQYDSIVAPIMSLAYRPRSGVAHRLQRHGRDHPGRPEKPTGYRVAPFLRRGDHRRIGRPGLSDARLDDRWHCHRTSKSPAARRGWTMLRALTSGESLLPAMRASDALRSLWGIKRRHPGHHLPSRWPHRPSSRSWRISPAIGPEPAALSLSPTRVGSCPL